jgi:hypothetical protein
LDAMQVACIPLTIASSVLRFIARWLHVNCISLCSVDSPVGNIGIIPGKQVAMLGLDASKKAIQTYYNRGVRLLFIFISGKNRQGSGGRRRPPAGSRGGASGGGQGGEAPYEGNAFFTNYTVILHFLNSAVR